MFKDTITLFNRYESRLGDTWYATIIRGVHVTMDKAAISEKYGSEAQDTVSVLIPFKDDPADGITIEGKKWLPPKEWDKQVNELLPNTITFTSGTKYDFILIGEWDGNIVISDEEYSADSGFDGYMNRVYDYVFAITSVGGPYTVIPHFEILGK